MTSAPEDVESTATIAGLPDWLTGSGIVATPSQSVSVTPSEEELSTEEQKIPSMEPSEISDEHMSDLPAWMQGVDQESLKKEVEEEMESTSVVIGAEDVSSYENIPDWLKSTPVTSVETTYEPQESPEHTAESVPSHEEKTESKQEHSLPFKRPSKPSTGKEE